MLSASLVAGPATSWWMLLVDGEFGVRAVSHRLKSPRRPTLGRIHVPAAFHPTLHRRTFNGSTQRAAWSAPDVFGERHAAIGV